MDRIPKKAGEKTRANPLAPGEDRSEESRGRMLRGQDTSALPNIARPTWPNSPQLRRCLAEPNSGTEMGRQGFARSRHFESCGLRLSAGRRLSLALNSFGLLFHRRGFTGQFEFRSRSVVLHIVGQVVGAWECLTCVFGLAAGE